MGVVMCKLNQTKLKIHSNSSSSINIIFINNFQNKKKLNSQINLTNHKSQIILVKKINLQKRIKKPKLDSHSYKCQSSFTCLDCSITFNTSFDWKSHTTCITEAEKFQKSVYKAPKKGKSKDLQSPLDLKTQIKEIKNKQIIKPKDNDDSRPSDHSKNSSNVNLNQIIKPPIINVQTSKVEQKKSSNEKLILDSSNLIQDFNPTSNLINESDLSKLIKPKNEKTSNEKTSNEKELNEKTSNEKKSKEKTSKEKKSKEKKRKYISLESIQLQNSTKKSKSTSTL
ncbi:hypothetical protein DFH28DRAFT_1106975 [Melampsora americana]|nr:hypothetical protein DFH28DRAFT_1106975 [Melampsora americana]